MSDPITGRGAGLHGWVTTGGVLTIAEQVEMLASQRQTGELLVTNGHCKGTLYFRGGQLVEAVCGTSGKRGFHGAACVLCMSGNPASEFRPTPPPPVPQTMAIPTMGVILEAARRMDEGERPCLMPDESRQFAETVRGTNGHTATERYLRVLVDDHEEYRPLSGPVARVGRADDCDVIVPHGSVSRRHADLHRIGPLFILRDMGSRNGTFVNGKRIEQARVNRGDEIRFAMVQAFLVGADASQPYRKTEPVLASPEPRSNLTDTMQIRLPATDSKMQEIRPRL